MGTWLVAYELCDSCEADKFGYEIDRVLVSDFVTPQFFETFWKEGQAQFDFRNHIKRPLQILEDGYLSVKHESGSHGWQEIGPPKRGGFPFASTSCRDTRSSTTGLLSAVVTRPVITEPRISFRSTPVTFSPAPRRMLLAAPA